MTDSQEVTCVVCMQPALARFCARAILPRGGDDVYVHDACINMTGQRIQELLEANTRYVEEARAARREGLQQQRLVKLLLEDHKQAVLCFGHFGRIILAAKLADLRNQRIPQSYQVFREGNMIFDHFDYAVAYGVYEDNFKEMLPV